MQKKYNIIKFAMKVYLANETIEKQAKIFLEKHGIRVGVFPNASLNDAECYHADMQFSKMDCKTLVHAPEVCAETVRALAAAGISLVPGLSRLQKKYPGNIPYNILNAGNYYFHNVKYTDEAVKSVLQNRNATLFPVRQGYAGCSSVAIPVEENQILLLSSDRGIVSAAEAVCAKDPQARICAEYFTQTAEIRLAGYNHGLIGGCCGYDRDLGLLLYGKANRQLVELSAKFGFPVVSIYDGPLTDIGGILVMYPDL